MAEKDILGHSRPQNTGMKSWLCQNQSKAYKPGFISESKAIHLFSEIKLNKHFSTAAHTQK